MCLFERESFSCGHHSRPFAIPGTCWRSPYGTCVYMNGYDHAQHVLMRGDCGSCYDGRGSSYYTGGRSTIWLEPRPSSSHRRGSRSRSSNGRSSRSVSPFGFYY